MNIDSTDLRVQLANDVNRGFATLVASYQHQLYAFLLRRLGDPQEAEDIVQETFLQAYYTLKRYPAERIRTLALRAWLYKIARNVYINSVRRFKAHAVSLETLDETQWSEPQEEESLQPEQMLETLEARQELKALIYQLPPHYAETLILYYFEHLSYQEIAYVLDCPPSTVRSYRHRGIQFLRKALLSRPVERRPDQDIHATQL
jgi:RNA polymerase sigma-70 factor, ECF subfamily